MRLEKIKLAGFKSFVDPTTIPTPGNLVGIVGPNGCGKSNIIDAVRWVMGESSAKHLRGESMADVIFNGSSSRKPVGMASVELVFDNTEGKAPGEFASYPQISIKRQVSRDGQSVYILNGTRCRRKDITDLFLGTGLGSRSYAIIEQGTISRLIEAKPAELRELIEEAAGISRYKERRHETELRMGHTQENLERLMDLRDEVSKQLETLKRQAKKAEKYTALKAEEQLYREQLLGIRWRKYDNQLQSHKAALTTLEIRFRTLSEDEYHLNESLELHRRQHEALQKRLGLEQGRFYELGADINRLSQSLKHARETLENLTQEECRLHEAQQQAEQDLDNDRTQLETLREELIEIELALAHSLDREAEAQVLRDNAEQVLRSARQHFETVSSEIGHNRSQTEIQRARLSQLEQQSRQIEARLERLHDEQSEQQDALNINSLEDLQLHLAELDAERISLQKLLTQSQDRIQAGRETLKHGQLSLDAHRAEQHALNGRISSLETLQQHAMGKDRAELKHWLAAQGLEHNPRLAQQIDVQPGWESAVESVLSTQLQAVCVDGAEAYLAPLATLTKESIALFETTPATANTPSDNARLIEQIKSPWNLAPLLGSVYCADDLEAAHALGQHLADHESVVTPEGVRLGPGWLSRQRPDDGKSGIIKRERDLRDMKIDQEAVAVTLRGLEQQQQQAESAIREAEHQRDQLQSEDRNLAAEHSRVKAELSAATARTEQASKRLRQLAFDIDDLTAQRSENSESATESRTRLLDAEDRLSELEQLAIDHAGQRGGLESRLAEADAELQGLRDRINGQKSRQESLKASEALTMKHLERAQIQHEQSRVRLDTLRSRVSETGQPNEEQQAELEDWIEQRAEVELSLADLRQRDTSLTAEIRNISEARLRNERELNGIKAQLEEIRLELSANDVRQQTVQEQLDELGADSATVAATLPKDADEKRWQQRVTDLADTITQLGAVNLTASEEYAVQEERMAFLEQQHQDLTDSLTTLREAIDKIDKECRSRFKQTFDQINAGLQSMFPKLFGGGQASLELTDRDLLDAGVTVMARPPGKRNSSIHLLSGGEKALTAAALVFAIFELNPAPFCLLDEVDAPLDDANVGRFSELVKEMSERVQFLFISHNKVTMEIAQHLAGVTMREPGVSRIVAVDIDAAVELAAI